MKKLVLFAGVLVAASFAACTGSKTEAPAAEAEVEAVVEEVVDSCCMAADSCCMADSCCADSVVAE